MMWSDALPRPARHVVLWDSGGVRWKPVQPDGDSFASIQLWAPENGSLAPLSWIEMLPYGPFTDTDPNAFDQPDARLSGVEHYTEACRLLHMYGEKGLDIETRIHLHTQLALVAATVLSVNRNKPTIPDDWKDAIG